MGRPKGSKNKPKEAPVRVVEKGQFGDSNTRVLLKVTDLDFTQHGELIGWVEGKGDWNFKVISPFLSEKEDPPIAHAFCGLGPDGKPDHLMILFERDKIRSKRHPGGVYERNACYSIYFSKWEEEDQFDFYEKE